MTDYLDAKSRDRLKALCKVGKLFDAQRLLEEHGTCHLRKTKKWTPLYMAVFRGFHSLVEVLLRYDHAQWDLKRSRIRAQRLNRHDLAAMILACPYWTDPIDPVDALASGELSLIQPLIEAGLDLREGDAVCQAAIRDAKGVLSILPKLGYSVQDLEEQLSSAMVSLVARNKMWGAWQLLRAGLDARKPATYYDEEGRTWEPESAILLAIYSGNHRFLEALKPDPTKDDEYEMVRMATSVGDDMILKILLDAGFRLNCKSNGGSPAIDQVLAGTARGCMAVHHLGGRGATAWGYTYDQKRKLIGRLQAYCKIGAKWVPDVTDSFQMRCVRDTLLALGEHETAEVIEILREHGAGEDDIRFLFKTARMSDMAAALGIGRKKAGRGSRSPRS